MSLDLNILLNLAGKATILIIFELRKLCRVENNIFARSLIDFNVTRLIIYKYKKTPKYSIAYSFTSIPIND